VPVIVGVALGGALGASARYLIDRAIVVHDSFPWSTLVVNLTGCFLIGLLAVKLGGPPWVRVGVVVGVLGGYTTFSAFGAQTLALLEDDRIATSLLYVTASVVVGVLAVWTGARLGRAL